MKIYWVIRWGSDESGGPDEEDTNFLIRAESLNNASEIADSFLINNMTHEKVQPKCNCIFELGHDVGIEKNEGIIIGPSIAFSIPNGRYQQWSREDITEWKWVKKEELYNE